MNGREYVQAQAPVLVSLAAVRVSVMIMACVLMLAQGIVCLEDAAAAGKDLVLPGVLQVLRQGAQVGKLPRAVVALAAVYAVQQPIGQRAPTVVQVVALPAV